MSVPFHLQSEQHLCQSTFPMFKHDKMTTETDYSSFDDSLSEIIIYIYGLSYFPFFS